ncbi:MAG: hypothetical protein R2825_16340 [Saprospiraceae bacterium]
MRGSINDFHCNHPNAPLGILRGTGAKLPFPLKSLWAEQSDAN